MGSRGEKFLCPGCNVLGYVKRHGVCSSCAKDIRLMRKVHGLIVRRHPELGKESLPMIVLRLWIHAKKAEPATVAKARSVFQDAAVDFAAEPEQEELF